jgi:putative DNA primase/helicase
MNAETIAKALPGKQFKQSKGAWTVCCPAHDDSEPSLSITDAGDGRVLVHCHAGCEQKDVIAALRARGLWGGDSSRSIPRRAAKRELQIDNCETAKFLWGKRRPITDGCPAGKYFRQEREYHGPISLTLGYLPPNDPLSLS